MMIVKVVSTVVAHGTSLLAPVVLKSNNSLLSRPARNLAMTSSVRGHVVHRISDHLQLTTGGEARVDSDPATVRVDRKVSKPMVIIMPWLMARPKHTVKFSEFYVDLGFDVLTAFITPFDVLWPVRGIKVAAQELVDFLHMNTSYQPLVLHGFSAGGYLWGETCLKLSENLELYQPIVDRFVGQIWDSVVEFTQSTEGFPLALFPNSKVLQVLARNFMRFYMHAFYHVATCHYIRASEMYHANLTKAPALFLLSKTDPVATVQSVSVARDGWMARGLETHWKVWDRSPHVKLYRHHPEEYKAELRVFLDRLGLWRHPLPGMRSKL